MTLVSPPRRCASSRAADQINPPTAPPIARAVAVRLRRCSARPRCVCRCPHLVPGAAKLDRMGRQAQARLDELDGLVLNVDEADLETPSAVQE